MYLKEKKYLFTQIILSISVAGLSTIKLLITLTMPCAVLKTIISLVHGYVACINIATLDVLEREKAKQN